MEDTKVREIAIEAWTDCTFNRTEGTNAGASLKVKSNPHF